VGNGACAVAHANVRSTVERAPRAEKKWWARLALPTLRIYRLERRRHGGPQRRAPIQNDSGLAQGLAGWSAAG